MLERIEYSKEELTKSDLYTQAISTFGKQCMLNGYVKENVRISMHHIIPRVLFDNKIKKSELDFLDNIALLSQEKHSIFNLLEDHFMDLAMDINAYLYLYRGICNDINIIDKINKIMSLGKEQLEVYNNFKEAEYECKIKKQLQCEELYFDIPPYIYEVMQILQLHYINLYKEIKDFLINPQVKKCGSLLFIKLKNIIIACQKQQKLIQKADMIKKNSIEILELAKDELRVKTEMICDGYYSKGYLEKYKQKTK